MATETSAGELAVVRKDLEGVITGWNKAAERMFGFAAQEVIGHPLLLLIPPDCQAQETAILERLRHGLLIKRYQTVRKGKTGRRIAISLTVRRAVDGAAVIETIHELGQTTAAQEAQRVSTALGEVSATATSARYGGQTNKCFPKPDQALQ